MARKKPKPGRPPTDSRPLVLIIDDVEDNRDMYAQYLEFIGFRADVAADGEQGLEKALQEPPDIVIMDLSMPKLDGWQATKRLRDDPRTTNIPILVLTGHALQGTKEQVMAAGADIYLAKPCLPEQVAAAAKALLKRKRRRQASRARARFPEGLRPPRRSPG